VKLFSVLLFHIAMIISTCYLENGNKVNVENTFESLIFSPCDSSLWVKGQSLEWSLTLLPFSR
jgi:hypothetical protein